MITLALDASTYEGDVALLDGARVLAEEPAAMKGRESEQLLPSVAIALKRAGLHLGVVQRIVCGAGPGSFTSLRIAGSIAKGLSLGLGVPLYAAPSLALVVAGANPPAGRYLAALDALREEFYVGLYEVDDDGCVVELEPARLVPAGDVLGVADEFEARVVSPSTLDGALESRPRAAGVARLGMLLDSRGPVDIASWEPAYGRLAEAQVRWESAHGRPLPR